MADDQNDKAQGSRRLGEWLPSNEPAMGEYRRKSQPYSLQEIFTASQSGIAQRFVGGSIPTA